MFKLFERIKFIPKEAVSNASRQKAFELCRDIDESDAPIIALGIELDLRVWTGDKTV